MGKKWTDEEKQLLREQAENHTYKEIGEMIGRTDNAVCQMATKLGIKKETNAGQFNAGDKAWNKGMSQEEFMSKEAIERTKKTRFKKGQKPPNTKFDGAISIRNSRSRPYTWIRVSEGEWQLYHQYLWEKHKGPVPEGHILVFKNGNSLNCSVDNLECITRAENARRNSDYQKAMKTMQQKGNHPSKNLSDAWIASIVAGHDEEIKQYLLDERPDIIRLARANYKLKRKIKQDGSDK